MFPPKTAERVRLIMVSQMPSRVKSRPVAKPHTTVTTPPMARMKQKTNKKMSSNMVPHPFPTKESPESEVRRSDSQPQQINDITVSKQRWESTIQSPRYPSD